MTFPSPGVHYGVSERDYHAIGHDQGFVSKSLLWKFAASPFKWKHGPPFKTTKAMDFGSLVDCILTGGNINADFAVAEYKECRTNEAKAWKAAQEESGKTVIKEVDLCEARIAVDAIRSNSFATEIMQDATFQASVSLSGNEPETGESFQAKCRLDIVPDKEGAYGDWIFDLKTVSDLNDLGKTVANFGYHGQAGLYLDLWNIATGDNRTRWGFIWCESSPPYETAVTEMDPEDIEAGRIWYREALALWCKCQRDQNFPSKWEDEIKVISRPRWAKKGEN